MDLAFFREDGDVLVPLEIARSRWGSDQVHGVAVAGALGRAAERCAGQVAPGLVAARFTVDLFRPARTEPSRVEAAVVRSSSRLCLVDVALTQGGETVARAGVLFLRPTQRATGELWQPDVRPSPPPAEVAPPSDEPRVPYIASGERWSQDFAAHQDAAHKRSWHTAVPVVAGERPTPFVAAASIADGTSLVTNLGTEGVQYINTDITLTLAREPAGLEIGLSALDRVERDGVAVGTAAVYDRQGPLGTAMVTCLANSRRSIDFEDVSYADDGTVRER